MVSRDPRDGCVYGKFNTVHVHDYGLTSFIQADIEVAVGNLLDLFAVVDPKKVLDKIKLHLLAHTHDDILRFGPLVGCATEIYECFNAVFRMCSIFSNHLAPSHDIAVQLAAQEAMKYRLMGGYWPSALPPDGDGNIVWE